MITTRDVVFAKIETTYNSDPGLSASTDAILVEDPSWSHEGARMNDRPATRPSLAKLSRAFGGSLVAVEFSAAIKGPGSAYSASVRPEMDALLRACGFGVTVVTTSGVETCTYKPVSTPTSHESITLGYYQDGTRRKLTGARGTVEFSLESGNRGMAKFKLIGHDHERGTAQAGTSTTITLAATSSAVDDSYNGQTVTIMQGAGIGQTRTITDYVGSTKIATVASWTTNPDSTSVYELDNGPCDLALPAPTYDSTVAPTIKAGAFTIASYAAVINAINFTTNNQIAMPGSVSGPDGYGEIRIAGRDTTGSFDPEHVLIATHDWVGRFKAGTTGALATGSFGVTQYNRYAISMPVVQYLEVGPGDREGIRTLEINYAAIESSGDDEVSIAFS